MTQSRRTSWHHELMSAPLPVCSFDQLVLGRTFCLKLNAVVSLLCYFVCLITVVSPRTVAAEGAWDGLYGGGGGWRGVVVTSLHDGWYGSPICKIPFHSVHIVRKTLAFSHVIAMHAVERGYDPQGGFHASPYPTTHRSEDSDTHQDRLASRWRRSLSAN